MPDEASEIKQEQLVFFPPVMITPRSLAAERVDAIALAHMVNASRRGIETCLAAQGGPPSHVLIAYALLPGNKWLVELQSQPTDLPDSLRAGLLQSLGSLKVPAVRQGPVVFYLCFALHGGAPAGVTEFAFPFGSLLPRGTSYLDEILLKAAGLSPEQHNRPSIPLKPEAGLCSSPEFQEPGRWRRCLDWILGRHRVLVRPRGARLETPPDWDLNNPEVPSDFRHHVSYLEEYTIDELTELIRQYPSFSRFYRMRAELLRQEENFDEAVEDYSRFLELTPGDATAYAIRGATHCLAGRLEPGLVDLNKALSMDPHCVPALQARAGVYRELEAMDQAEADLSTAIKAQPFMPILRLLRADMRFSRGEKDTAVKDLDEALRLDPHDEAAYSLRSRIRQSLLRPGEKNDDLRRALVEDLENAIRLNPDNPEHHSNLAVYYLQQGELDRAVEECDRALEADPGYAHALGLRALAWEAKGDSERALRDASAAKEQGADRPELNICQARALASRGEVESALELVEGVLGLHPEYPLAHDTRGRLRLELGDVDGAIEDFTEALRLDPELADFHVGRALARRVGKDFGGALRDLEEALRLDPSLSAAHFHRGGVLAEDGRLNDALQSLDECIRLTSDSAAAHFLRATVRLRVGDTGGAMEDLDTVIRLDADFAPAYFTRGNMLLNKEEQDAAMRDFDRLIDLCPSMPAAYSGRGNVWIQKGDPEKGAEDYEEAIRLQPESAERFMVQRLVVEAAYYRQKESLAQSIERASEAIALDPECWPAYLERATSYWYCERLKEALEDLNKTAQLAGESYVLLSARGQVQAELGRFDRAVADLDRALDQVKDSPEPQDAAYPLNGRGLAHCGMERYEEAAQDFEESLRLCPENAWAHFNRALMCHKRGQVPEAIESLRHAMTATQPPLPPRKRHRARTLLHHLTQGPPP